MISITNGMFLTPLAEVDERELGGVKDADGNRWAVGQGRHDLDATRGNPKHTHLRTCIPVSLSWVEISHRLSAWSKSKPWAIGRQLVGVSRWSGSWLVGVCEQTSSRLLYQPNPVWRSSLQQASQEATNCISVCLQYYYVKKMETQNHDLWNCK